MTLKQIPDPLWYSLLLVGGAAAAYFFILKPAGQLVAKAAEAVDPTNPENVFNSGFNATLEAAGITERGESLGSKLAGWLNPVDTSPTPLNFKK